MARAKNYAKLIESLEKKLATNQAKTEQLTNEVENLKSEKEQIEQELQAVRIEQLQAFMSAKGV